MKKYMIGFFALGLAALPSMKAMAQATEPFEGSVTFAVTSPQFGDDQKHEMVVNLKGPRTEMDIDAGAQGKLKMYSDNVAKKQYIVMESMNMGMKRDIDPNKKDTTTVELTPTGKTQTVAGHPASEYLLKTPMADVSLWATSDFPADVRDAYKNALMNSSNGGSKQDAAFRQLADKGMVPVKVVVNAAGQQVMSMEFVKFEKKKLDDALFIAPVDIKYEDGNNAMGGMH